MKQQIIILPSGMPMQSLPALMEQVTAEAAAGDIMIECQDTQYCHAAVLQWLLALHTHATHQRKRMVLRNVSASLQQDMTAFGLHTAIE